MYIENVKHPMNEALGNQKSAFACQFYSNKENTKKYLYEKKERMVNFLHSIGICIDSINKVPKETMTFNSFFDRSRGTELMHEVVSHVPGTTFNFPEVVDEYLEVLSIITFFNQEKRKLESHVEYENKAENGMIFISDELLSIGYWQLFYLDKKLLPSIIDKIYNKYVELYPKFMLKENIDVGINQAVSCYNPVLLFLLIAIGMTENPMEIINGFKEKELLVNYAMSRENETLSAISPSSVVFCLLMKRRKSFWFFLPRFALPLSMAL